MPNKANLHEREPHRMVLKGLSGGGNLSNYGSKQPKEMFLHV